MWELRRSGVIMVIVNGERRQRLSESTSTLLLCCVAPSHMQFRQQQRLRGKTNLKNLNFLRFKMVRMATELLNSLHRLVWNCYSSLLYMISSLYYNKWPCTMHVLPQQTFFSYFYIILFKYHMKCSTINILHRQSTVLWPFSFIAAHTSVFAGCPTLFQPHFPLRGCGGSLPPPPVPLYTSFTPLTSPVPRFALWRCI